jgi:hypothetical protein
MDHYAPHGADAIVFRWSPTLLLVSPNRVRDHAPSEQIYPS